MQEIGGHHHGDGRLTVVAVPNEGVQLAIKWHGLADHWFIAGQTMAKEDLAWVVQRCSGVSDEHQVMLGRPLSSCLGNLVREDCWRDVSGVRSTCPSVSASKFVICFVIVVCPIGATV
jgi:hypothetical protein